MLTPQWSLDLFIYLFGSEMRSSPLAQPNLQPLRKENGAAFQRWQNLGVEGYKGWRVRVAILCCICKIHLNRAIRGLNAFELLSVQGPQLPLTDRCPLPTVMFHWSLTAAQHLCFQQSTLPQTLRPSITWGRMHLSQLRGSLVIWVLALVQTSCFSSHEFGRRLVPVKQARTS